jgi:carboxypeptidase C (cathepsin A)
VVQTTDGFGTQARMWGWDRSSNMIYIDQPVQVGLSYDVLTNLSHNLLSNTFYPPSPSPPTGSAPSFAYLNGTFSSQRSYATPNTTETAAQVVWHFLQTWLSSFPLYNPGVRANSTAVSTTGINLFAESYGGEYGPVFADLFERQNDLRRTGNLPNSTLDISLVSLGLVQGAVDARIQAPFLSKFAYNNTYGIQAITSKQMTNQLQDMQSPGGCLDLLDQCRTLMASQDPNGDGDIVAVNTRCASAQQTCQNLAVLYSQSGRSVYDIRQMDPSPFPSLAYMEYLNTAQVMQAIGTSINYTDSSSLVNGAFAFTGDMLRDSQLPALSRLLQRGIRVALLYGDADYICNWQGGEAVSLALGSMLPLYASKFLNAGYADIVVNSSYIGGAVRQFGNLSFARIYDSGHLIPAYQPETAFTIFTRIIQGTALATGEIANLSTYLTSGPQFSAKTNKAGTSSNPVCWIRDAMTACTPDQRTSMLGGQGVVIDGVWYASQSDYKAPTSSVVAGKPGTPAPNATTMSIDKGSPVPATGVYVATGTPKPSLAANAAGPCIFLIFIALIMSGTTIIL